MVPLFINIGDVIETRTGEYRRAPDEAEEGTDG